MYQIWIYWKKPQRYKSISELQSDQTCRNCNFNVCDVYVCFIVHEIYHNSDCNLSSNCFIFNNVFYHHINGTLMGSSSSVRIAEIVMLHIDAKINSFLIIALLVRDKSPPFLFNCIWYSRMLNELSSLNLNVNPWNEMKT